MKHNWTVTKKGPGKYDAVCQNCKHKVRSSTPGEPDACRQWREGEGVLGRYVAPQTWEETCKGRTAKKGGQLWSLTQDVGAWEVSWNGTGSDRGKTFKQVIGASSEYSAARHACQVCHAGAYKTIKVRKLSDEEEVKHLAS